MNTIDLIILIPVAYFVFKGFTKGLMITLAMLAGLLLGFWAAINLSEFTAGLLTNELNLESENINLIAYLLTFVIVLVLVYLLGQMLTSLLKATGLGFANRLGGALIGAAKGLLIVSALIILVNKVDPRSKLVTAGQKDSSYLFRPAEAIAPAVFPAIREYYGKLGTLFENKKEEEQSQEKGI